MRLVPPLVAVDVAILPPADVSAEAVRLSTSLPAAEWQGLRLDAEHLPHVTLTQQFIARSDLEAALARADAVVRGYAPLPLRVTGGGQGSSSVWMAVERTPELDRLHRALMEELREFEQPRGDASAFADEDARPRDVDWVTGFRTASSFAAFTPHITLGHASQPPHVPPMTFVATAVAACQLGRFCTCRRVLRQWKLTGLL